MFKADQRYTALALALFSSNLLCSPGYARALYTHFLFFPKRGIASEPSQIDGIQKETVGIPVEGKSLYGWYFESKESPYVVLVNHGNSGNIASVQWIARNLLSAGVSVLVYDYRGYGLSKGRPTVESICTDGEAAYEYLVKEKGVRPEHVILYGQSLGCAVACHVSSQHQVAGLILQSGFSSLRNVAFQRFPLLRRTPGLVPDALDNQSILSQSKLPLLLIHGDRDRVVPFSNAEDLYESAGGKKSLVVCHNSGHRLYPESDAQHRAAVRQFISGIVVRQSDTAKISAADRAVSAAGGAKASVSQIQPVAINELPAL